MTPFHREADHQYSGAAVGTGDDLTARSSETRGVGAVSREQVRGVKDQLVSQTRQAFQKARDRAGSSLAENKARFADQLSGVSGAFRRTAEQLRGEDRTGFADFTESVAGQADRFADYLRRVDARGVRRDLENLARRQPAIMIGGALALGLLAARFLKSSERSTDVNVRRPYGGYGGQPSAPRYPRSASYAGEGGEYAGA